MDFLSKYNLSPFIVPILTFLVPPPNTAGLIALSPTTPNVSRPGSSGSSGSDSVRNGSAHSSSASSSASSNGSASSFAFIGTTTLHKAVARKFTNRLQQQIVVLLRRCHAVFPYFETVSPRNSSMQSMTSMPSKRNTTKWESLSRALEALDALGLDISTCSDAEIYSTHSRWIETDDMMHYNPLSLFSLLPNRFVQNLNGDIVESLMFLFRAHDSIENDASLLRRQREDSLHKLVSYIESTHSALRLHLSGQKPLCAAKQETFSDRIAKIKKQGVDRVNSPKSMNSEFQEHSGNTGLGRDAGNGINGRDGVSATSPTSSSSCSSAGGPGHEWKRDKLKESKMPQRVHFYAASKAIYDCLFKSTAEIEQTESVSLRNAMMEVHRLLTHQEEEKTMEKEVDIFGSRTRNGDGGGSELERKYKALVVGLDTDRLGRYSSLCCRRATECGRRVYLRDLVCFALDDAVM